MFIITIIPVAFAVLGLLLYMLSTNAKVSEIGRMIFFAAILVLLILGTHILR